MSKPFTLVTNTFVLKRVTKIIKHILYQANAYKESSEIMGKTSHLQFQGRKNMK